MTFLELYPLTAQHLSAVVELDRLCFGGLWTRSGYERELDSPNSQLLVLASAIGGEKSGFSSRRHEVLTQNCTRADLTPEKTPQSSLLGVGCYWTILEEAHITILGVHPDYRRQGLGKLLLYAMLRDAKRHQLERATLEVKPSNQTALSLYQSFGFTEAGRRRHYYKDTGEDALILWRSGLQTPEFEGVLVECYRQLERHLSSLGWQLPDSWEALAIARS